MPTDVTLLVLFINYKTSNQNLLIDLSIYPLMTAKGVAQSTTPPTAPQQQLFCEHSAYLWPAGRAAVIFLFDIDPNLWGGQFINKPFAIGTLFTSISSCNVQLRVRYCIFVYRHVSSSLSVRFSLSYFSTTDSRINSSPHTVTHMRQWIRSPLVQIMACRLFGAKPLPIPMLGYCRLDP